MSNSMDSMLSIIPPLILGGGLMMMTERFINRPYNYNRRRARRFDELEYRDLRRRKARGMGYGDFSNLGW